MHAFCFQCLRQWSEVNRSCPLCKAQLQAIIHNIRADNVFTIYQLPPPAPDCRVPGHPAATRPSRGAGWTPQQRRMAAAQRQRLRRPQPQLPDDVERRRVIYAGRLRLLPETDPWVQAHQRSIEPRVLMSTTNQERLRSWLEREVTAVVGMNHREFVMTYLMSLLQRIDIRNRNMFVEAVRPFFFDEAEHFWHELVAFARSPFSMAAYDQHAKYLDERNLLGRLGLNSSSASSSARHAGHEVARTSSQPPAAAGGSISTGSSSGILADRRRGAFTREHRSSTGPPSGSSSTSAAADAAAGSRAVSASASGSSDAARTRPMTVAATAGAAAASRSRLALSASRWDSPSPEPRTESDSTGDLRPEQPVTPPHLPLVAARIYRQHVRNASHSVLNPVAERRDGSIAERARSPVHRTSMDDAEHQPADYRDRRSPSRYSEGRRPGHTGHRQHRERHRHRSHRSHASRSPSPVDAGEHHHHRRHRQHSRREAPAASPQPPRSLEDQVEALRREVEKQQERLARLKQGLAV